MNRNITAEIISFPNRFSSPVDNLSKLYKAIDDLEKTKTEVLSKNLYCNTTKEKLISILDKMIEDIQAFSEEIKNLWLERKQLK